MTLEEGQSVGEDTGAYLDRVWERVQVCILIKWCDTRRVLRVEETPLRHTLHS